MKPERKRRSRFASRAGFVVAVVVLVWILNSDWFQKPDPDAGLFGVSTWVGAFVGGVFLVLMLYFSTIFTLSVVLKITIYYTRRGV